MQSATALFVTSSSRPKRSFLPRSSTTEGDARTPDRNPPGASEPHRVRPGVDDDDPPDVGPPDRPAIAARIPAADASGSRGEEDERARRGCSRRRSRRSAEASRSSCRAGTREYPPRRSGRSPGAPPRRAGDPSRTLRRAGGLLLTVRHRRASRPALRRWRERTPPRPPRRPSRTSGRPSVRRTRGGAPPRRQRRGGTGGGRKTVYRE